MSPALCHLQEIEILHHRVDESDEPLALALPLLVLHRFAPTVRSAAFDFCSFPEDAPHGHTFPHLKRLVLQDVAVSQGTLQGLLSGCSVLETLLLNDVRSDESVIRRVLINSPSLRIIENGYTVEVVIENAPRLERLITFWAITELITLTPLCSSGYPTHRKLDLGLVKIHQGSGSGKLQSNHAQREGFGSQGFWTKS
ncbi:uncharacterized protein [Lolium perenne]|uniref:uncharacterized protein n=1 Tax=Lolium perenne TaxID=4522 RepID=UPI0021F5264D|nr:uncharacterized protein LOC127339830 [Lolium perenne]